MNYSHILWDFNGTLLNDVEAAIQTQNALLAKRKLPLLLDAGQYRSVFTFPVINYYKNLGYDLEKESFEALSQEWVQLYLQNVQTAVLQPGVRQLLNRFQQQHFKQTVLSATEQTMLVQQVKDLGISAYFEELLGLDTILASSKIGLGRAWLQKEKPAKALMIGDTVHDYEVACALGVDCVLVALGHQNRETLQACGARVCDSFLEICEEKWE